MVTAIILSALLQTAAINSQRDGYMTCLDQGVAAAKAAKLSADALSANLKQSCAASGASFRAALIAFDVKNKVARSQATADAQAQTDELLTGMVDQYRARAPK